MIAKIKRGIGSPGKLWTGDIPKDGSIVNARIIERTCSCGKTTRKFRCTELAVSEDAEAAMELPTLFVTMGGVGSVFSDENTPDGLQCWNWSKRVGGHVIINPLCVINGYVSSTDLPPVKTQFQWVQTYIGSTLNEVALIWKAHQGIEVVKLQGDCPPCRNRKELGLVPEGLIVTLADLESAGVEKEDAIEIMGKVDSEGGTANAKALLSYIQDGDTASFRGEDCCAKIRNAILTAGSRSSTEKLVAFVASVAPQTAVAQ